MEDLRHERLHDVISQSAGVFIFSDAETIKLAVK